MLIYFKGTFDENGQMELNLCQINQPYNNLRRCELAGITGHGGYHFKQAYDCSCKVSKLINISHCNPFH